MTEGLASRSSPSDSYCLASSAAAAAALSAAACARAIRPISSLGGVSQPRTQPSTSGSSATSRPSSAAPAWTSTGSAAPRVAARNSAHAPRERSSDGTFCSADAGNHSSMASVAGSASGSGSGSASCHARLRPPVCGDADCAHHSTPHVSSTTTHLDCSREWSRTWWRTACAMRRQSRCNSAASCGARRCVSVAPYSRPSASNAPQCGTDCGVTADEPAPKPHSCQPTITS